MRSPVGKSWGRGYTLCELPQAKPKIALVLPSLNFKASPFSLLPPLPLPLQWLCSGHRPRSLGGPPNPSIPQAELRRNHMRRSGVGKAGEKKTELINTLCLPPNSPLGKVNYIQGDCAHTRQSFSTVQHCPALPGCCFLTTVRRLGRPRGTHWWEDHKTGSKEAQVLTPAIIHKPRFPAFCAHIWYASGYWAQGLISLFPDCGKNTKYFSQISSAPDSIRKHWFAASKFQSSREFS